MLRELYLDFYFNGFFTDAPNPLCLIVAVLPIKSEGDIRPVVLLIILFKSLSSRTMLFVYINYNDYEPIEKKMIIYVIIFPL